MGTSPQFSKVPIVPSPASPGPNVHFYLPSPTRVRGPSPWGLLHLGTLVVFDPSSHVWELLGFKLRVAKCLFPGVPMVRTGTGRKPGGLSDSHCDVFTVTRHLGLVPTFCWRGEGWPPGQLDL
jgi:hypothetical protein